MPAAVDERASAPQKAVAPSEAVELEAPSDSPKPAGGDAARGKAKDETKKEDGAIEVDGKAEDGDEPEDGADDNMLPEARPTQSRREVPASCKTFRNNTVHIYGLDFLRTEHMDEIFSQFQPKYVEWIDDSSANVIFKDATVAKTALESLSFPKTNDTPWRRTPDILVTDDAPPIFLQMRLAVADDKKNGKRSFPSAPAANYQFKQQPRRPASQGSPRHKATGIAFRDPGAEKRRLEEAGIPLSEEELAKRRKRAERFGEDQAAADPPAAPADETAPARSQDDAVVIAAVAGDGALTKEEAARRQKRAERFGDAAVPGKASDKQVSEPPAATESSRAAADAAASPAAAAAPAPDKKAAT